MAQRRMFSSRIANSARFLQMPMESQLLYFHMILQADDDGIVESYPIIKILGVALDSFKVLLAKGFIEQLNEDQVIVINDWREHNNIRADRKINSIYLPLLLRKNPEAKILLPTPRSDVKNNAKRLGGPSTVSIGKVRLGKYNKETNNTNVLLSKKDSKNSHMPLTALEVMRIAIDHRVDLPDVRFIERQVLNPENVAKYKNKTTYYTVKRWIDMAIQRGQIKTLDETGFIVLKTLYGDLI